MPLTVLAKSPITLRTSKKIYRLAAGDVVELSDAEASQLRASGAPELQSLFVVEDTTPPLGVEVTEPPKTDSGAGAQDPHPEPVAAPAEEPTAVEPAGSTTEEPAAAPASDPAVEDPATEPERSSGRRRRGA